MILNSAISYSGFSKSLRTSAGFFLSPPTLFTGILCFGIFWFLRTNFYSGDGDQIDRMTEAGTWLVQSELLSQDLLRLFFVFLHPWGWDGFAVLNFMSCLFVTFSVIILLRYNAVFCQADPLWVLLLFFSSCYFQYGCGHPEYYPIFLPTLLLYGYLGSGYLQGRFSILQVSLGYSLAAWMHLGVLFALPSLFLLPLLKKTPKDYQNLLIGLIPIAFAFLMKRDIVFMGLSVQGESKDVNFVPLFEKTAEKNFYTMFSWGHLTDILWGWTYRSWIYWPLILFSLSKLGFSAMKRPDRIFHGVTSICFIVFALLWHPDLRITQDWDLFAFEAAPALLLLITFLPEMLTGSYRKSVFAIPAFASFFIMFSIILVNADFGNRGYGRVVIQIPPQIQCNNLTLNGHQKKVDFNPIRQGTYKTKIIDGISRSPYNFYTAVAYNSTTVVHVTPVKHIPVNPSPSK